MSPPPRILVADDDALLREVMCEGLEDEGFEVVAAEDGANALELFRTAGPFDALLLDEEMPRLTGRQLLAQIRGQRSDVPALLISGNLEMDDDQRATLGVGPVLRKPVSIEDLVQALRRVIGSKGPAPP